jgi:immune inhibitor A
MPCHCGTNRPCRMPPSPDVLRSLRDDYKRSGLTDRITFEEYLRVIGFTDPSVEINGMDDSILLRSGASGPEMFSIPKFQVTGELEIIVVLIDFPDLIATRSKQEYEKLLFGPTASLEAYYREVSNGKVNIHGAVHGWFRMTRPYADYTAGRSGTDPSTYPGNAQGMAEDAVKLALVKGVPFNASLDKLDQGIVTALFVVHAGRGAEVLPKQLQGNAVWSHKWFMRSPLNVGNGLTASIYLTVPEDCELGVCAHELGHLAFQWEDFYDANYNSDGDYWDGSGDWDLMASGSYNGDSKSPAYPAGLHRVQHGWIPSQRIQGANGTSQQITLKRNEAVMLSSDSLRSGQYLLLENRQQTGFDRALPGHGLLTWRVDETRINTTSVTPGLFLLEADANRSWQAGDYNQGDDGDPFPGSNKRTSLSDTGSVNTSFPGQPRSGISIDSVQENDGVVTLTVRFA